jgi:hypothetical protein
VESLMVECIGHQIYMTSVVIPRRRSSRARKARATDGMVCACASSRKEGGERGLRLQK